MKVNCIIEELDKIEERMRTGGPYPIMDELVTPQQYLAELLTVRKCIKQLYEKHVISSEEQLNLRQYWAELLGNAAYETVYEQTGVSEKALKHERVQMLLEQAKDELVQYYLRVLKTRKIPTIGTSPVGWSRVEHMNITYKSIRKKEKWQKLKRIVGC